MSCISLKCRKCRNNLINDTETPLLSSHNVRVDKDYFCRQFVQTDCKESENSLFFQEEGLPTWIIDTVNEANWLKGKLYCPSCSLRLGSFNFVSGQKCNCGNVVVPPVHIIKSKVDWVVN